MIARGLLLLALSATSSVLSAQSPAGKPDAAGGAPVDSLSQTEDVQFRTGADTRMTVPVTLSGTGPYRFLVDTGADRTAISRELAARLNLVPGAEAELHSVTGVSTVATATLPQLQLTRKPMKVIDAPVLDSANIGADGILGVDSLRSQRIMFDFKAQSMAIVPSATPDFRDEPGTIVIEARRKNGRLIVANAAANGHDVTVVLDTGSQICIGNSALRSELRGRNLVDPIETVQLESVTGEKLQGDYMFVKEVEIGGVTLRNLAVVFADAHTFRQLGLDNKPAILLGMNAIRAFKKVSIDFANRTFRIVLPEESALHYELADVGLAKLRTTKKKA